MVVEGAKVLAGGEVETDFFKRFANRRRLEVSVGSFPVATGEGHLAGPGIARLLRPLDEKDFGLTFLFPQNDGYRCLPGVASGRDGFTLMASEALADAG